MCDCLKGANEVANRYIGRYRNFYAAKSLLSTLPIVVIGALGGAGVLSLSSVGITTLCLGSLGIAISVSRYCSFPKKSLLVELAIPIIGILGIAGILPSVGYVALGCAGFVLLTNLCVIREASKEYNEEKMLVLPLQGFCATTVCR